MRVLCPSCQQSITLSDSMAGLDTTCPWCSHRFRAPELLTVPAAPKSTPAVVIPPPPVVVPDPPPVVADPPPAAAAPVAEAGPLTGDTVAFKVVPIAALPPEPAVAPFTPPAAPRAFSRPAAPPVSTPPAPPTVPGEHVVRLDREAVRWLVPVGLTLAFVAFFLPWVGSYPAGTTVYRQAGYQVVSGGLTTANTIGQAMYDKETAIKEPAPKDAATKDTFRKEAPLKETALKADLQTNWMLVLFVLVLLAGLLLAWGDWWRPHVTAPFPTWAQQLWPARQAIVGGIVAGMLVILAWQSAVGFGLETSVARLAESAKLDGKNWAALPSSEVEQFQLEIGRQVAGFALGRSWGYYLAFAGVILAAAGAGLEFWLDRRFSRPVPEAVFRW